MQHSFRNKLSSSSTSNFDISFIRHVKYCCYPKDYTLQLRCFVLTTRPWDVDYKLSRLHYYSGAWVWQISLGSQHLKWFNLVSEHCQHAGHLQLQFYGIESRSDLKLYSSLLAMLESALPITDNFSSTTITAISLAPAIASCGNILKNHKLKFLNMSCPLNPNQTKSTTFVWNEKRTRLSNTAAITLPYYASLNASQLTRTELTCDLPNTIGSMESELGCSTQSSPLYTLKVDDPTVLVGTCDQLEPGLATDTNQTHSRLKLNPEMFSQRHRLRLTTRSSQSASYITHDKHTQSYFDEGSIEVPTSLVPRSVPQEVPTSCGTHRASEQGGSDLLAHARQVHVSALEASWQPQHIEVPKSRDLCISSVQCGSDHIAHDQKIQQASLRLCTQAMRTLDVSVASTQHKKAPGLRVHKDDNSWTLRLQELLSRGQPLSEEYGASHLSIRGPRAQENKRTELQGTDPFFSPPSGSLAPINKEFFNKTLSTTAASLHKTISPVLTSHTGTDRLMLLYRTELRKIHRQWPKLMALSEN